MRNILTRLSLACLGVLAVGATDYARADVVYNTVTAFDAATTNNTFIGFNGILPSSTSFINYTGTTLDGATFNSGTSGLDVNLTGSDYYAPSFSYAADFLVSSAVGSTGNDTLDVSFTNPTSALALDFGSLFGGTTTLTLSDGFSITNTSTPTLGDTEFLGFLTSTPITGFTLSTPAPDAYVLQDLTLASPVPEPGSILLLGTGVIGIGLVRRRRKKESMVVSA